MYSVNTTSIKLHVRKVYKLSFFCLFAGIALSSPHDWSMFARSGSVLVLIGVLYAYRDYRGRFKKELHEEVDDISGSFAYYANYEALKNMTPDEARADPEIQKNLRECISMWKESDERIDFDQLKIIDVTAISIGTVVWGFGDLIGRIPFIVGDTNTPYIIQFFKFLGELTVRWLQNV